MIIGLVGPARSGKDTVAGLLVEHHGFVRVGLADAVKDMALAVDPLVLLGKGWRLSQIVEDKGWEAAKEIGEVRRILQSLGTEGGRRIFGDECWVDVARRKSYGHDRVVWSDVRFRNEATRCRHVVRVTRPGFGPLNGHASEVEQASIVCDWVIVNDGTLDDLAGKVAGFVRKVG